MIGRSGGGAGGAWKGVCDGDAWVHGYVGWSAGPPRPASKGPTGISAEIRRLGEPLTYACCMNETEARI